LIQFKKIIIIICLGDSYINWMRHDDAFCLMDDGRSKGF
jgi:hypothetical protein